MAPESCLIESLPNEILVASLAFFSARELIIHVLPISRRFRVLATRILYRRLVETSPLPHNELILECYHPSAKISTPYLSCRYLGLKRAGEQPIHDDALNLGDLNRLYSSFRPVLAEENRGSRRRQRSSRSEGESSLGDEAATQDLHLDDGELFSQLCTATNVVKETTTRGLFVSHINTCDGVIRVWRQWLAEKAGCSRSNGNNGVPKSTVDFENILWVDTAKNVGLRFRVELGPVERMPLMYDVGDDAPVTYTLTYQGTDWLLTVPE
ncbi:hypothetical protein QQS21_003791 [Conoideocrella luteorostrata]|uniref:F-box domain-containing protein n=1 Tax=Conoideocrella luteorostrata TaxID=1105319 RepID=A0AAJ0FVA8_9HYPO|nr:hypothetical protein QQS21_003791 [Conoideocrella luteorostrata]